MRRSLLPTALLVLALPGCASKAASAEFDGGGAASPEVSAPVVTRFEECPGQDAASDDCCSRGPGCTPVTYDRRPICLNAEVTCKELVCEPGTHCAPTTTAPIPGSCWNSIDFVYTVACVKD
jgi:hypothetical protein